MLRNKSTVTSSRKQALMADFGTLPSPKDIYRKPNSSIFLSPRLFSSFSSKGITDTESLLSPTSILDGKPFSALRNPFWSDSKIFKPETRPNWDKLDSRGVGLGIVDALQDDKSTPDLSKPDTRMVLFGSQLKIQIPPLPPSVFHSQSESPADFGIKTRNALVGRKSPPRAKRSDSRSPPGFLSASDMELSEDYTRVVSHGPNPKTTHIFDDCIVESCCGVVGFSAARKESLGNGNNGLKLKAKMSMSYPSESFLSFCYSCKKNLGHGKDIYMYRGEKAFCSCECREKEMMLDEEEERAD